MSSKISKLVLASALFTGLSSTVFAADWEAPAFKTATAIHAGADLAAAYDATNVFSVKARFLGSDLSTSASMIESNRVGTHVGVDIAAGFAQASDAMQVNRQSASIAAPSPARM